MHMTRLVATFAVVLVPAALHAQTPAPQPEAAPTSSSWTGSFNLGVRGTSADGDAARYERYRDLSDGAFLDDARLSREYKGWLFDVFADHVGRRDQRYAGTVDQPGLFKGSFLYDQIPMLLSRTTRTLFTGIGTGELPIDDALQLRVQTDPAAITTVFDQFSRVFETQTRRKIGQGSIEYEARPDLTFRSTYRHTNRDGTIPYGGSFGHSSLVELPAPTEFNISEFEGSAEFSNDPGLVRVGYSGSWFHNDVTSVIFDNPFRAVDSSSVPSRGRLAIAPSSSFINVNALGSLKLPHRSRVTGYVSLGSLQDAGDALIPQTINLANVTRPIERTTVEGEAKTTGINLNFVSRPTSYVDINVRYKRYEYDNQTPEFAMIERVAYDNTPAAVSPAVHTEPFSVARNTFDADFLLTPGGRTSAGVGYTRIGEERTHRIFDSTADNVFRVLFDAVGHDMFTIRSKYEHGQRRGEGIEQGEQELAAIGEQPGMRHFDVASRDRDRVTVLGTVTPFGSFTATFSFAAGKDDYLESEFGVRDNTHRVYSAGGDYAASDNVTFSLAYTHERYTALSRSRQANPGVQFTDPSRNWASDATDKSHSVIASMDVNRIKNKVNLHVDYDFSRARARYDYITGPVPDRTLPEEVIVPSTLPTPTELPPVLSELQRGTTDIVYLLTSRLSVGLSYWFERYRVEDFTLDAEAQSRLAIGQAVLMGYLYRPYTAHTVWGRLILAF